VRYCEHCVNSLCLSGWWVWWCLVWSVVVGFGCWLWWLWCVVVGGLVGGGSCACRVPVTQVALCERRAGALSERKKKATTPYKFIAFGAMDATKP
jgi:hypothetical protein